MFPRKQDCPWRVQSVVRGVSARAIALLLCRLMYYVAVEDEILDLWQVGLDESPPGRIHEVSWALVFFFFEYSNLSLYYGGATCSS